jgi:hypothetical protein
MLRTNEPLSIGDLYAVNVFGNDRLTNHKVKQIGKTTTTKITKPRVLKPVFEPTIQDLAPIYAYWPMLDNEARKRTMNNYRLEVAKYNLAIEELNLEIEKYNAQVELFCAGELNEVQKTFPALWIKNTALTEKRRKRKYDANEYNALVEEFNNERGMLLKKRKESKERYQLDAHFESILQLYSKQLTKFTSEYIKLATTELCRVRPVEINSDHQTSLERNLDNETFVYSLPVCNATARRNRKKLEKMGILHSYEFQGHTKGVKMQISSKILVLFDAKTGKYTNAENQSVTPETCKQFTDKNKVLHEQSITIDKKKKSGTASPEFPFVFYKNILAQDEKSKLGGGEKSVKVSETLSDKLQNTLLADKDLAVRLAAGEFYNHSRIDREILDQECYKGTLDRETMMEFTINQIVKHLSKIYRKSTPYAGPYQKAMNNLKERFYVNNGNGKFIVRKEVMVNMLEEWIWRIDHAHRWFLKTGIRPLNPHDYLDTTRTHKKEIGFEYTKKAWNTHLKNIEKKPIEAKKTEKNAEIRKINIEKQSKDQATYHRKKADCLNNRISIDQFIDFVDKNLPPAFLQQASEDLIKQFSKNQSKYDA